MTVTLVVNFILISGAEDHYYKDIWNPVPWSVEPVLNYKREVRNPQGLYAVGSRKYGTTLAHVLLVISCIYTLFLIRH